MTGREIGRLFKDAGVKFWDDKGPRLGAALTFYLFLSLSPLVLTVVTIGGFCFGDEAARGELVAQIRDLVGQEGAVVIEQLLAQSVLTSHGVWSGILVVIILLIGASGLFSSLQSALNAIWMEPGKKTNSGVLTVIRERFLAFLLVWGTAFLLLVSLVVTAILTNINARISGWLPQSAMLAEIVNLTTSFCLTTLLFTMIFKWLPETNLAWSDVWMGAAFTAGMIVLARYPIGLYLHRIAAASAFGAAEAFVVFLVWGYYSSQLFLLGAELTFLYATRHGRSMQSIELAPRPVRFVPATH
jgi:membrane protein